jgi:O-antigen/teichoic acid export membrane protein
MFKPIKVNILSDKINFRSLIPFAEVLSKLIAFINILLMMRVLLIEEYADYSYIVTIVLWAAVLMDSGINNLVFNYSLKGETGEINGLFTSRFVLSIIVIIGLSGFFIYSKPELAFSAFIFSIVIYFNTSSVFIKMIARGKQLSKIDFITILSETSFRLILFLIVFFIFPKLEWELWMLLLIYLFAGLLSFLLNYYFLSLKIKLRIKIRDAKQLFNQVLNTLSISKYYLFYFLIYIIIGRMDVVFIEKYAVKTELALFSSAMTLYEVIQLFFFSIITSHFFKIYKSSKKALIYFLIFSGFVILMIQLLSPYVYRILFPKEYIGSVVVLNHVIIAIIPSVIVFYLIAKLNYENKPFSNFVLLIFPFLAKLITYNYFKSPDLNFYYLAYLIIEYFTMFCFLLYTLYIQMQKTKNLN